MQSFVDPFSVAHTICAIYFHFELIRNDVMQYNAMWFNAIRCDVIWSDVMGYDGWVAIEREKNPWKSQIVDKIDVEVCIFLSFSSFVNESTTAAYNIQKEHQKRLRDENGCILRACGCACVCVTLKYT